MLVGAGLEAHVAALAALEARDRVGGDRLIGVADVRRTVGIADRGRDVEGLGHVRPALAAACLALQGRRFGHRPRGCRRAGTRSPPGRATGAARSPPARAPWHKRRARARAAPRRAAAPRARSATARDRGRRRSARPRPSCRARGASSERRALVGSPWRRIAERRILELGEAELGKGQRPPRRAERHGDDLLALGRAQLGACASRIDVMASSSSVWKSSRRQRERIVGSSRPGAWLTRKNRVLAGGSSSILSRALAPDGLEIVDGVDHRHAPRRQRRGSAS